MRVNSRPGGSCCMYRRRIFICISHCQCKFSLPFRFFVTFIAHYLSAVARRVAFIASCVCDSHFSATSLGRAVFLLFIPRRLLPRQCLQQHIAAHPPLRIRPEGRCRAGGYNIIFYFLFSFQFTLLARVHSAGSYSLQSRFFIHNENRC